MAEIIVTTSETIPGKTIQRVLGIAKGNTVRARHIGRDIIHWRYVKLYFGKNLLLI